MIGEGIGEERGSIQGVAQVNGTGTEEGETMTAMSGGGMMTGTMKGPDIAIRGIGVREIMNEDQTHVPRRESSDGLLHNKRIWKKSVILKRDLVK